MGSSSDVGSFCKRLSVFALLLAVASGGLYGTSEVVAPVYPEAEERVDILEEASSRIQAITLRNSHNRSIDFDAMDLSGFHLWSGGGDVFEAKYIFRNTRHLLTSLEYVFIPVSPFARDNAAMPGWRYKRLEMYKRYSWKTDYLRDEEKLYLHAQLSPLVRPDNWGAVFGMSAAAPDSVAANGWIYNKPTTGHPTASEVDSAATESAKHHLSIQEHSLRARPGLCQDVSEALSKIADDLGPSTTLVLYKPPYPLVYEQFIDERNQCAGLQKNAKLLAQEHPSVSFFDMSSVLPNEKKHTYFLDGDHLNGRGAEVMSSALRDSVRNLSKK